MSMQINNSGQSNHLEAVLAIITDIAKKSADANYIYRGEPEHFPKVSSNLYRQYEEIEVEDFSIETVQQEMLDAAQMYTSERDAFEILTQLQHYGGKTNLIDFTTDFLIAIFFACDGSPDKDGRVIFLERSDELESLIKEPRNPANRVIAQKSIFVQPPKGFIQPDHKVTIPNHLKQQLLAYLRDSHGISTESIYNDIFGFISRYQNTHQSVYTELYRGKTSQNGGDLSRAVSHYSNAIAINPSLAYLYVFRGIAYDALGVFDSAVRDFSHTLELNPNYAGVYTGRGSTHYRMGDFDKAIELDSGDALSYLSRGQAYHNGRGDFDKAIVDYDKAIELDPGYALGYFSRGQAYHNGRGDFDKAIVDYDKAIELDPDFALAYYNRGLAYQFGKGDFDSAIRDHSGAIARDPDYFLAYYSRGLAYQYGKSDSNSAIGDYSRVINLNPSNELPYFNRCICWLEQSAWDRAKADLTSAINLGMDVVSPFQRAYTNVEGFERRYDVTIPQDIVEILGG